MFSQAYILGKYEMTWDWCIPDDTRITSDDIHFCVKRWQNCSLWYDVDESKPDCGCGLWAHDVIFPVIIQITCLVPHMKNPVMIRRSVDYLADHKPNLPCWPNMKARNPNMWDGIVYRPPSNSRPKNAPMAFLKLLLEECDPWVYVTSLVKSY